MVLVQSLIFWFLSYACVNSLRITPKTSASSEPERRKPSGRSLHGLIPDQTAYDALYSGLKKPITVDCTQPGIVCKFPLVVETSESSKPAKNIKHVPIIKGVEVKEGEDANVEAREDVFEREDVLEVQSRDMENEKVPVFKGSSDVEAVDFKNSEDSWILEKNYHNKKYQIPVRLVPSKANHDHRPASLYPSHIDFHDHFSAEDPYHLASNHHSGWSPWMRSYPAVYSYNHHNDPCQPPPIYHHPPPCDSSVRPTRKPLVNVDDKVEKDEE